MIIVERLVQVDGDCDRLLVVGKLLEPRVGMGQYATLRISDRIITRSSAISAWLAAPGPRLRAAERPLSGVTPSLSLRKLSNVPEPTLCVREASAAHVSGG